MIDWNVIIGDAVTQILRVLIPVFVALIAKWAIQVYQEIKKSQPDFALVLQTAVNQAVIAAEQMMQTEDGKQKKAYAIASVQDYLAQKGMVIDVSVIEDAIEATVYSLHRENFFLTKEQRGEDQIPPEYEVEEENHE
jgi:hypothetical protein